MSAIDPAIQSVIDAKQSAVASQIATTIAAKSLDAVRSQGDAINQLLQSAARLSKSLSTGQQFDAQG